MEINPDIPEAHALRGWYDASSGENYKAYSTPFSNAPGAAGFSRDKFITIIEEDQACNLDNQLFLLLYIALIINSLTYNLATLNRYFLYLTRSNLLL